MKKTFLLFAAFILLSACGDTTGGNKNAPKNTPANNSGPAAPAGNTEADVSKLIGDLAAALSNNDAQALDKIYADDYTLVTQTGEIATKAQRMEAIKAGNLKFENVAFSDVKVRGYGDTAVAMAKSSGKSTADGKTTETNFQITFVANKSKDGWRFVSAQLTPLAAAAKPDDSTKKDEPAKPADPAKPGTSPKSSDKPANK